MRSLLLAAVLAGAAQTAWRDADTPAPVWDWLEANRPKETLDWKALKPARRLELLDEAESALKAKADEAAESADKSGGSVAEKRPDKGWAADPTVGADAAAAVGASRFDKSAVSVLPRGGSGVDPSKIGIGTSGYAPHGAKTTAPPLPGTPGAKPQVSLFDPMAVSLAWNAVSDRTRSALPLGVPVSPAAVTDFGIGRLMARDSNKGMAYEASFGSWMPLQVKGNVDVQTDPSKPKISVDADLTPAVKRQLAQSLAQDSPVGGPGQPPAAPVKPSPWAVSPNVKVGPDSLLGAAFTLDGLASRLVLEEGARVGISGAKPEGKVKVEASGARLEAAHSGTGADGVRVGGGYNREGTVFTVGYTPATGKAGGGVEQQIGKGWSVVGTFERGSGDTSGFVVLRQALGTIL